MAGDNPKLETEWLLLRAACSSDPRGAAESTRTLLASPVRWKLLLDLSENHGLQPLLYRLLSNAPGTAPVPQMQLLERAHQANLLKALLLSRELIRALDALEAIGVEALPYKGLALAEAFYGDIALRQSGDIDLLIRPQDLPRVREAMRPLGYEPHGSLSPTEERAYIKSGYECAFDAPAGRNLLEVQWAIQPRFYAVDYDMEGVFQRAVRSSVAGREMKTPSAEDLFLILAIHAAKHVWARLIWLCDLARIMNSSTLNWSWIGSQAKQLGIVRLLRVSLLLVNRLLDESIPAAAEASLPADPNADAMRQEIEAHILGNEDFNVESFDYFRLMMKLRERRTDRMRFLTRLAFTPGPGEWAAIRLPRPLFPLYRVVRISRLAAKIVGA
jgi:hypothetical protein